MLTAFINWYSVLYFIFHARFISSSIQTGNEVIFSEEEDAAAFLILQARISLVIICKTLLHFLWAQESFELKYVCWMCGIVPCMRACMDRKFRTLIQKTWWLSSLPLRSTTNFMNQGAKKLNTLHILSNRRKLIWKHVLSCEIVPFPCRFEKIASLDTVELYLLKSLCMTAYMLLLDGNQERFST